MEFKDRLKLLRKSRKLSMDTLAKAIYFTRNTIFAYEHGSSPSVETIIKIARFFNVTTDYLLGVSSDPGVFPGESTHLEWTSKCRYCRHTRECKANHWVVTFDKNGKTCDNFEGWGHKAKSIK